MSNEERTMSNIPKDPFLLFSFINMQLRDNYASLEEFCAANDADLDELLEKLNAAGFEYNAELNHFLEAAPEKMTVLFN